MNFVEKVSRTVEDAITEALMELGVPSDEANVEILEKGSKGFLGIGAKLAKVRVTAKTAEELAAREVAEIAPSVPEVEEPVVTEVEAVTTVETPVKDKAKDIAVLTSNAVTFLTQVLKEMGIDATFETSVKDDKLLITISGEKMGMIIGRRGETLDALQYITNIAVNKGKGSYLKVMLDTENYRAKREETLRKLAFTLAKKASKTRKPVVLEPMNPYDRRIIHSALQNNKYVKTNSEGVEPYRKVVITPVYSNRNNTKSTKQ